MNEITGHVFEKKYPMSKNNRQCLSSCYPADKWVIHPVTLDFVSSKYKPFCAVDQWQYVDQKSGEKATYYVDECYVPVEEKDVAESQKEIEMNILIPKIDFSCSQFLKIYYGIHSLEEGLTWIVENKSAPIYTRMRIVSCSLDAFGKEMDIVDERLVDFFIEVIKKLWITSVYSVVKDQIKVSDGEIYFDKNNKNNKKEEYKVEKINFLVENFVNKNTIYKFLAKYVVQEKKYDMPELKDSFRKYIFDKIGK